MSLSSSSPSAFYSCVFAVVVCASVINLIRNSGVLETQRLSACAVLRIDPVYFVMHVLFNACFYYVIS